MKKLYLIIFIFAQVFGFGQKCLEIDFVQEAGGPDFPARSLFNYASDFNTSYYEIDRLMNATDTLVTNDVETRLNRSISRTNTTTIMPISEKSLLYKDFGKDSIQSFESVVGEKKFVILEERIPAIKWEISSEKDSILDFEVQKATTHFFGRDYVAWFAPDIPLSDGPRRMHGLPGMILKAESLDGFVQYYPVNIRLENKECYIYSPLTVYPERRRITIDEQGKMIQEYVQKQEKYQNSKNPGNSRSTVFIDGIEKR